MLLLLLACIPELKPEGTVDTSVTPFIDEDGDGWGIDDDCDDNDPLVFPEAEELCDGLDNDCDGIVPTEELDEDEDGMMTCEGDCDDTRADVYEGAEEPCDYVDNDCDGQTDEDGLSVFYADTDTDGFGDSEVATEPTCGAPEGYVADDTDCDDANIEANPGMDELCSTEFDDDCDGEINEDDAADVPTWYADADEDSFGDENYSWTQCEAPAGTVLDNTDCNDVDDTVFPGADEVCNGVDDDCDGVVPSDETDDDGDGYVECTGEDCDDTADDVYLGADEYCNTGVDEDCDGTIDEDDDAVDSSTWYADSDGDGDGDADLSTIACNQPANYVSNTDDCDDSDDTVYDGATELCDGQDNDCDGSLDISENDDDNDGYVECTVDSDGWDGSAITGGEDCNDGRALTNPGADEYCNTYDDDCDGTIDEDDAVDATTWYADTDGDGYGDASTSTTSCDQPSNYVTDTSDCDDGDITTYPGATEVCGDGVYNDCNASSTDECGPYGSLTLDDTTTAFFGDGYSDYAGYAVDGGDVDGDGNDDVLVLARYGATYGQVGVFYGPVSGDYDMADADLEIEGIYPSHDSNDRHWVTQARLVGDITDGGGDDLLVAAQGDGAVYVFEGPVTGGSLDLDDADFYIDVSSTNYGNAGDEMVSLDLNDDGYEDLVVSAPGYDIYGNNYSSHTYNWGRVYVAYGPLSSNKTTFDADEGDLILTGEYERSTAGESLATGDFDADGVDELVVGAPTDTGGTWQIAVFQDHAGAAKKDLTDDAEHYWQGSGNYTGSDLGVGDQNGDGYDDLVIGARGANTAYIINGPLTGSSTTMTADVTISGPSGGTLGDAVDLAGDIDADGYADLIASSYKTSTYKGRTYFLAGPLTGTTSISSADGTWTGDSNYDYSGYWQRMTYAGDADGDGYDDVLVGATNVDESTTNAGAAWLISGGPNY